MAQNRSNEQAKQELSQTAEQPKLPKSKKRGSQAFYSEVWWMKRHIRILLRKVVFNKRSCMKRHKNTARLQQDVIDLQTYTNLSEIDAIEEERQSCVQSCLNHQSRLMNRNNCYKSEYEQKDKGAYRFSAQERERR